MYGIRIESLSLSKSKSSFKPRNKTEWTIMIVMQNSFHSIESMLDVECVQIGISLQYKMTEQIINEMFNLYLNK